MKSEKKILRRDFIIYFFSAFILGFIVKDQLNEEKINIDSETINKIKTYNSNLKFKPKIQTQNLNLKSKPEIQT